MSEQEIQELLNTVQELTASVKELTEENARLRKKLDRMNELLLLAQQARFGQSSEKREYVLKGGEQMRLFNEAEQLQDPKAPEPTQETLVAAHTRKPKRPLDELLKDLPVKKIVLELGEDQRRCDTCGSELTPIGEKFLRRELNVIPRQVEVIEYYTRTYACKPCEEKTGYANFYTVENVPPLLKHSLASPSSVANVMTQKYVDGIPLYRQEQIWKRDGIALSRATLANWVIQGSKWLKPLVRRMKASLTEGAVIHADETVVQVHKEEGKENTSESRMWVYTSGPFERRQVRYFEYQPDRSGKHPAALTQSDPLRMLGAYAPEVAGGHAERSNDRYLKGSHRL